MLFNLLANALDFTDAGGEVLVEAPANETTVRIAVRDTGIGIPQGRLADVFEPFVQVDGSLTRSVGGTGLRLAMARDLVRAMDGTIAVESEVGTGSCCTVTLPRGRSLPPSAALAEVTAAARPA